MLTIAFTLLSFLDSARAVTRIQMAQEASARERRAQHREVTGRVQPVFRLSLEEERANASADAKRLVVPEEVTSWPN